jgi:hypothetical protein
VMSIEPIGHHSTAVHGEGSLALLYTPKQCSEIQSCNSFQN